MMTLPCVSGFNGLVFDSDTPLHNIRVSDPAAAKAKRVGALLEDCSYSFMQHPVNHTFVLILNEKCQVVKNVNQATPLHEVASFVDALAKDLTAGSAEHQLLYGGYDQYSYFFPHVKDPVVDEKESLLMMEQAAEIAEEALVGDASPDPMEHYENERIRQQEERLEKLESLLRSQFSNPFVELFVARDLNEFEISESFRKICFFVLRESYKLNGVQEKSAKGLAQIKEWCLAGAFSYYLSLYANRVELGRMGVSEAYAKFMERMKASIQEYGESCDLREEQADFTQLQREMSVYHPTGLQRRVVLRKDKETGVFSEIVDTFREGNYHYSSLPERNAKPLAAQIKPDGETVLKAVLVHENLEQVLCQFFAQVRLAPKDVVEKLIFKSVPAKGCLKPPVKPKRRRKAAAPKSNVGFR